MPARRAIAVPLTELEADFNGPHVRAMGFQAESSGARGLAGTQVR